MYSPQSHTAARLSFHPELVPVNLLAALFLKVIPIRLYRLMKVSRRRVPTFKKIDKERRFVVSMVSGEFTYAEALAHQGDLSADPDFDPTFAQICDFTHATSAKISSEEVLKFAQRSLSLRTPGGL